MLAQAAVDMLEQWYKIDGGTAADLSIELAAMLVSLHGDDAPSDRVIALCAEATRLRPSTSNYMMRLKVWLWAVLVVVDRPVAFEMLIPHRSPRFFVSWCARGRRRKSSGRRTTRRWPHIPTRANWQANFDR